MASVVEVRGSAPREAGARMVVLRDGSFTGTIGGGALEWQAIADAQAAIASAVSNQRIPPVRMTRQALGPDLGQCCGGFVRVLLEVFEPSRLAELGALAEAEAAGPFLTEGRIEARRVTRTIVGGVGAGASNDDDSLVVDESNLREQFGRPKQTLALFGAGHVGRALVLALAPLDFSIVWIDPRDGAFPSVVPGDVQVVLSRDPVAELAELPDDAFVMVMSHSHALDFDVVYGALRTRRFAHVGLIGSATKRARFQSRLRQAGMDETDIEQLVCPIGIKGIESKQPSVIAASVVADLLYRMEELARTRKASEDAPRVMVREVSSK
jgi:xanthine dehydrogenase accessory factor